MFSEGGAGFLGSLGGSHLVAPIVGMASTPGGTGYWLAGAGGAVYPEGSARSFGSLGGTHRPPRSWVWPRPPVAPATGWWVRTAGCSPKVRPGTSALSAGRIWPPRSWAWRRPGGTGYWLVGADGGVFAEGDAGFHGSLGGVRLAAPIVGMVPTPDGNGYWLVGADGGVFAEGDAGFHGSLGGVRLAAPIVGITATHDGKGYWLVGADGGVFAEGDAQFQGSLGGVHLAAPIVGMTAPLPEAT